MLKDQLRLRIKLKAEVELKQKQRHDCESNKFEVCTGKCFRARDDTAVMLYDTTMFRLQDDLKVCLTSSYVDLR